MPTAAVLGGTALLGAISSRSASKRAASAQEGAARAASEETRRAVTQARGDLFKLFPAAQQNLQQGFQGALDVFGQALPAQAQTFQAGNIAAQQQLLSGLPQFQQAILGGNIDFSQLQPTQLQQPDLGFLQQQLPEIVDPFAPPPVADIPVPQRQFEPFGGTIDSRGGSFGGRSLGGQFPFQIR